MTHVITNIVSKGLIIMALVTPISAAADATQIKLGIVNPPTLSDPTSYGYSTAVVVPAGVRMAYISGQGAHDQTGGLSSDFGAQVRQAYKNLGAALEALGARPEQVAKLTIYVVDHDMSKLGVLTDSVKAMFGDRLPAQTLVPVPKLAIDQMLVEVEAVVALQ